MSRRLAALALLLAMLGARSAAAEPVIELVTMGPGEELFSRFGHAAICLGDSDDPMDARTLCHNYGTTDFNRPNLVLQFLKGTVKFWVGVEDWEDMYGMYERADRTVYRQRLALDHDHAAIVLGRLANDLRPENREYLYDHFRDNCSTRLRDMIDAAVGGQLRRATEHRAYGRTFRQIIQDNVADNLIALIALELFVGPSVDRHPSVWEAMFLPDVLRTEVAALRQGDRPLAETEILYQRVAPEPTRGAGGLAGRATLFMIAGLLAPLMFLATRRHGGGRRAALAFAGLKLGLLAVALDVFTRIAVTPELHVNQAMLILLPTDLALPVLAIFARRRTGRAARAMSGYLALRVVLLGLVGLLMLVGVLGQAMAAVYALTFALLGVPLIASLLEVVPPEPVPAAAPAAPPAASPLALAVGGEALELPAAQVEDHGEEAVAPVLHEDR